MTHANPVELHDHAYGFRPSAHVAGCAECLRRAETLSAERSAIRAALLGGNSVPVRRSPAPLAGLAAAVLLLAALAWILYRAPHGAPATPPAAALRGEDDLDRLVAELKSPSPVHRELAALALKAYGGLAVAKLEKAGAALELIDACRGTTPAMRAVLKKLDTMKLDLNFDKVGFEEALKFIRDFSGVPIIVDAAAAGNLDPNRSVTLQAKGDSLGSVLGRICALQELKFMAIPEGVLLVTNPGKAAEALTGNVPIKVLRTSHDLSKEIAALGSDAPAERDRATASLRTLGFAAERSLWGALDGPAPETRARAADLLRSLYSPAPAAPAPELETRLRTTRITIDLQNTPLTDLLAFISQTVTMSIVIDTEAVPNPEQEMISFKVADIGVDGALRLMLGPRQKTFTVAGDAVLITGPDRFARTPRGPFWTDPKLAKRVESLIDDLASEDAERQGRAWKECESLGTQVLGPLLEAAGILDARAAERCRAVARSLAVWLVDEPSGVDLQKLPAAQAKPLGDPLAAKESDSLEAILKRSGLKYVLKAKHEHVLRFSGPSLKAGSILKLLTRPYGLDFYLDGEAVVVDTAANVRAAVTK